MTDVCANTLRRPLRDARPIIAATMLLIALAVVRSWCADEPWKVAASAALGAGIIVGMGVGRPVAARLRFHGSDGLLAADALNPSTRRRYVVAWHAVGIVILAAITLVARPSLLIVSAPAYLAGGFVAHTTASLTMSRAVTASRCRMDHPKWLHPCAGSSPRYLAVSLYRHTPSDECGDAASASRRSSPLSLPRPPTTSALLIIAAMAHGACRAPAQGLVLFAGLRCGLRFAFDCPAGSSRRISRDAALLSMRVLAYCLHAKRFADLLVSLSTGLLVLVAYSMPILLPFLAIAILWQLQRRAAARRWLLA